MMMINYDYEMIKSFKIMSSQFKEHPIFLKPVKMILQLRNCYLVHLKTFLAKSQETVKLLSSPFK